MPSSDRPRKKAPNGAGLAFCEAVVEAPPTDGCIEWPYGLSAKGYGRCRYQGKLRYATHVVLELSGKPRPPSPGDHALHSCDNAACVNPKHLRWDTNAINRLEEWERQHAKHPNATVTPDEVRAIRARYKPRVLTAPMLADEYGIGVAAVKAILQRRTWRHL